MQFALCDKLGHLAHITAGKADMTAARGTRTTKQPTRAKAATGAPRPSGSANFGRLGHRGSPARWSPRRREDRAHQLSAPPALVEAAKREAGVTSTSELGVMALAMLARPDPVAAFFHRTAGRLGADHDLEY